MRVCAASLLWKLLSTKDKTDVERAVAWGVGLRRDKAACGYAVVRGGRSLVRSAVGKSGRGAGPFLEQKKHQAGKYSRSVERN